MTFSCMNYLTKDKFSFFAVGNVQSVKQYASYNFELFHVFRASSHSKILNGFITRASELFSRMIAQGGNRIILYK